MDAEPLAETSGPRDASAASTAAPAVDDVAPPSAAGETAGDRPRPTNAREADGGRGRPSYWLTRFVLLRLLGFVYCAAFLSLATQLLPLIGHDGLLPAAGLSRARRRALRLARGGVPRGAVALLAERVRPRARRRRVARLRAVGGGAARLRERAPARGALGALPLLRPRRAALVRLRLGDPALRDRLPRDLPLPAPRPAAVPAGGRRRLAVIWLFRWLAFRIMLGAGLIKLRGDPCWRDLTCLYYHYETQPIPNPLSWWLHFLPRWVHRAGVALQPRRRAGRAVARVRRPRLARHVGGAVMVALPADADPERQPVVPELADDRADARVLRRRPAAARAAAPARRARRARPRRRLRRRRARRRSPSPRSSRWSRSSASRRSRTCSRVAQMMNTSFDPLDLVNTYGAFGSVGRERDEIVFEGTADATPSRHGRVARVRVPLQARRPDAPAVRHRALPAAARLADLVRRDDDARPRAVDAPPRVEAAARRPRHALGLLANDPFPDAPPRFIRALLYRYHFAPPGTPGGAWWTRTLVGTWLPPLSLDDPRLRRFVDAYGWR